MIESNIINWVDLGDSMQSLDVYGKKKLVKFFNLMRVLIGYKTFSIFFFIILKFFFFLQILMLTLVGIKEESDSAITILKYISKVIFIQEIISDSTSYKIAVIINSVLTLLTVIGIVYLVISVRFGKLILKLPIYVLNLINVILLNYLIGPIVQISIMATTCSSSQLTHKYLLVQCYSDWTHIAILIASIINLLFWVTYSSVLSIYFNEIGSVNESKVCARINCNYELYINIAKIVMFVLAFVIENYGTGNEIVKILVQVYVFLNSLSFSIYVYKTVLFFDNRMNVVSIFGWVFVAWFSFVILLKSLLKISDTTLFHVIGWIILGFILYYLQEYKEEYLLTDFNIFEAKSLKEIELFNLTLIHLMNQRSIKSKTLLIGIIKKFEDFVKNSPELSEKYQTLESNEHLKKKFNSNSALPILSIIYIIYDHHIDKSQLKNDILLNFSYFLINKFKNTIFAISLCSKFKVVSHKHLYFKYILMEEIKSFLINKLSKSNNKESIKHVQIGSVILYNNFIESFKVKIFDAACYQIDYFDQLKSNVSTPKTTETFLKIGESILTVRKEIFKLWEKIIELNPFSDESEKDYMLYLETILQDDVLARTEAKKYSTLKTNKLSERNNIFHSLFIKESSSIILVDGYSSMGKILSVTHNFPELFNFSGKEILNMTIEELMPNVVAAFHKELVDNAIKYSNWNHIFNAQRDLLLKGKTGGIFNVKIFVKCIPNLSFGLVYMVHITKIQDHNYIIILDKDFKINGLTDMFAQGGGNASYTMNNNYGLTQNLYGHHIALVLPEILLQIEYKEQKFMIQKSEIDLKGNLYPVIASKDYDNRVERVLDRIKQCGKLSNEDEPNKDSTQEYEELLSDISMKYQKPYSIFYKIVTKSFLNGKFQYHRVYITNDLIALNENNHSLSIGPSLSNSKRNKRETKQPSLDAEGKESAKHIKMKVGIPSENKVLLDDRKEDDKPNDKRNDNFGNNDLSKPSAVQSSIDSANFNKLKNNILEKKEISSIKIMRYLCFFFGITTIAVIVANAFMIQNNFESVNKYLQQNLFFNHSKIDVSCVYISTLNIKWVKDTFIKNNSCSMKSCRDLYSELLSTCILDIKTQKENSSNFYEDFKKILAITKEIELKIFNIAVNDKLVIDIDNLLNLLVTNSLKLNANLNTYETGFTIFDINSYNILKQSLNYINDKKITGFDQVQKRHNLNAQFLPVNYSLIVDCIIFFFLNFGYGWLIFRLNVTEKLYLGYLIKFHSENFDLYLKKLEDLKKKLKSDSGEEDDKINGDLDVGEFGSKKESKSGDDETKDKARRRKKEGLKDEDDKDKSSHNKRNKGRKKNHKNTVQKQKEDKQKTMSKYFFTWNLLFIFKVFAVLVISITYYLVSTLIELSEQSNFVSFDSTTNDIEGIYKSSFDIFLLLKTQLADFEIVEEEKRVVLKECEGKDSCSGTINGVTGNWTQEEVRQMQYEGLVIPQNSEIVTPKLENLLMPLVNDKSSSKENIAKLNQLYNGDSCAVLFLNTTTDYGNCSVFWSSILIKGMEQSITQMGVVINTVIDELNSLKNKAKSFVDLLLPTSSFRQYEMFVQYYLFKSYMITVDIFLSLKRDKTESIYQTFNAILYGYCPGIVVLFFILLYLVYSSKVMFNSFLNFIGIMPVKFLNENENNNQLYKEILRLEKQLF